MNYSKGISWFDDCRIPFVDENVNFDLIIKQTKKENTNGYENWGLHKKENIKHNWNKEGRFPPNLLCSDDMLNDGSVSSKGKMKLHRMSGWGDNQNIQKDAVEYQGDKGTNSRYYDIDAWFDQLLEKLYLL